jgi:hypothetical protein
MGEIIQFIPKAERERIRLIQEARALYDSVLPPTDFVDARRKTPMTNVRHGDQGLS